MSSEDAFDDSLDDLLANITSSQLDPSLKRQTGDKQLKSSETQTDLNSETFLNRVPKRKLVLIQTDKHHHKPCLYHNDSPTTHPLNKKMKSEANANTDSNEDIWNKLSQTTADSQLVLIPSEGDLSTDPMESHSTQNLLINDSFEMSDSSDAESDKSLPLFETDDELDYQRSPLLPLSSNESILRSSQNQLLSDEDLALFKTQNSSSSQNSSVLSF